MWRDITILSGRFNIKTTSAASFQSINMSRGIYNVLGALALLLLPSSLAWDYCAEHWCTQSLGHVACNNNGSFGSKCSQDAELLPLSLELRNFIVYQINSYRNLVASGRFGGFAAARRMASVQWDPELATLAELTARQCRLKSDDCRNTRRFKHVGQTMGHVIFSAYRFSDRLLLSHKIDNWFRQYKHATSQLNAVDSSSDITSFRQLMQERATHIGCGVLRQTHPRKRFRQQFIVCNYAREDAPEHHVYMPSASAGSGCAMGVNPEFPNLCALHEPIDVNVVDDFVQERKPQPKLQIRFKYSEDGMRQTGNHKSRTDLV